MTEEQKRKLNELIQVLEWSAIAFYSKERETEDEYKSLDELLLARKQLRDYVNGLIS